LHWFSQHVAFMQKLERVAYICLIAVSLLAGGMLIEQRLDSRRPSADASESLIGKNLKVGNDPWNRSHLTVAIALSSRCHFCAESLPFYRQLTDTARKSGAQTMILSPDSGEDTKSFLAPEGVSPDFVVSTSFRQLGIRMTPTLMLVDSGGVVRRVFRGKLDAVEQDEVLALVRGRTEKADLDLTRSSSASAM